MKKIFKISLLAIIALGTLVTSCKKDETLNADLSALDRSVIINTALDNWLDANYLTPYNIQVKYRWDAYEDDLSKDLVPPKESQVQPTMEAVRDIWIKPYEAVGGATFMKINTPKQFYLVGSPSYNDDGTITLGTAEGGKKITLFVINNFTKSNAANTQEMMHVIHHEFTHILNQKIAYDPAFKLVTPNGYTGNWNLISTATARSTGFITAYAQASPIEDFAEMTSIMLTQGKYKYDAIVNALATSPKALLRQKEQYVVTYFKAAWNIDFYALQTQVSTALDNNASALNTVLGIGKAYTSFASTPLTTNALTPQSADFLTQWNTSKTALAAQGYTLASYSFLFGLGTVTTVRYTFTSGANTYNGDADYNLTTDANGVSKFTLISPQPTGTTYGNYGVIKTATTAVTNYIINNTFKIDYAVTNPLGTKGLAGAIGTFYKSTDATSYMIGTLN
ncbi:substrate import-associated zinc metallohydrolase lipoprotein [Mucilaginibacter gracilis]|uniref:Substrate import-associated zinc metallohydrolase lipoprotein n=1 Tax=Mucilaginibacter gracilis TaxID=423350 RepID=A0A495IY81_9SPHI|nr:putative zinc-binding metallopeptidase [Mucilaginibacter gracilis]RKR81463.1 substrate import-associated zinc metallohydrolase lipoprotein [Mucilaginibacter gracilis]